MSELLKRKHMLCILVCLLFVAGVLIFMSMGESKHKDEESCGCGNPPQNEGYISPSLRSMMDKKESLYTPPKEKLINYVKPPERFVPSVNKPPQERFVPNENGNSMMNQMNQMRGSPVSKSMNSMASPVINFGQ